MLRNLFCVVVAVVWTVVCFVCTLVAMIITLNPSASMWVVQKWWSPVLIWAGGGKLSITGLENFDPKKPHIFVSNHQSTIDIPVLFWSLPVDFRYVAKKQLQYVPFLGWYMTLARYPFVDRGRHSKAVKALTVAADQIRGGVSIVMFAEGTRSDDNRVAPFKKGPFALAMKAGVPLVPVTIEGTGKLMPKNSWNITPGPIHVKIGKPIETAQFGEDREALIKAVRDIVIDQSIQLGGLGGDKLAPVAARGVEGSSKVSDDEAEGAT